MPKDHARTLPRSLPSPHIVSCCLHCHDCCIYCIVNVSGSGSSVLSCPIQTLRMEWTCYQQPWDTRRKIQPLTLTTLAKYVVLSYLSFFCPSPISAADQVVHHSLSVFRISQFTSAILLSFITRFKIASKITTLLMMTFTFNMGQIQKPVLFSFWKWFVIRDCCNISGWPSSDIVTK